MVDVAADAGRDDDVAALLAARVPDGHRCDSPWCCRGLDPDTAIGLLATLHERHGRIDDAIALLHTRDKASLNNRDQLADLLARHNRIDELRAYAATEPWGSPRGAWPKCWRSAATSRARSPRTGKPATTPSPLPDGGALADLLARHSRNDEAIDVMRALADAPGGAEDWILHQLCTLYADQGRPEDGLAYLDARTGHPGEVEWELLWMRLPLMAACGRVDEAYEQVRAHPEGGTPMRRRTSPNCSPVPDVPKRLSRSCGPTPARTGTTSPGTSWISAALTRPWPSCSRARRARHSPSQWAGTSGHRSEIP
ncbi:tetratricopeptide repeat protein [Streptomyces zhihengii]